MYFLYGFLNNIFSSLLYCKNTVICICKTYKICINQLFIWLAKLPVNSRLLFFFFSHFGWIKSYLWIFDCAGWGGESAPIIPMVFKDQLYNKIINTMRYVQRAAEAEMKPPALLEGVRWSIRVEAAFDRALKRRSCPDPHAGRGNPERRGRHGAVRELSSSIMGGASKAKEETKGVGG